MCTKTSWWRSSWWQRRDLHIQDDERRNLHSRPLDIASANRHLSWRISLKTVCYVTADSWCNCDRDIRQVVMWVLLIWNPGKCEENSSSHQGALWQSKQLIIALVCGPIFPRDKYAYLPPVNICLALAPLVIPRLFFFFFLLTVNVKCLLEEFLSLSRFPSGLLMFTGKTSPARVRNPPTHRTRSCWARRERRDTDAEFGRTVATVCIVMSVAVYAVTPTTGLCCCFSAALQRPAPPLAHNFRPVSPATRVSAHGEQPTSPDESFCQYSHDHWEREGEERGKERETERDGRARSNSRPYITYISRWGINCYLSDQVVKPS